MLGVFPGWSYEDSTVELRAGDRLFLFTDGITEASDALGRSLKKPASQHSQRPTAHSPQRG